MNRLKSLRESRGMKQSELGKFLNVQDAAISKYESGKVQLTGDTLLELSKLFNVSTDYILGNTDSTNEIDLSWRYPPVTNRIGTILSNYRKSISIKEEPFAKKLGIPLKTYIGVESGIYAPSMRLLNKISKITNMSIDYLTGAENKTVLSIQEKQLLLMNSHFHTRFEELCIEKGINDSNCKESLGLSHEEYIDIKFNRMPTLSELLRISYGLNISLDYLIGKNDELSSKLTEDEAEILQYYNELNKMNKRWIVGQIIDLLKKQEDLIDKSVAADEQMKSAK